jgi:hypothetical protein
VCTVLLPHARAVLDLTSGGMWRISQALGQSGSYQAARDLCQEITAAHEQDPAYGPDHRETLAARVQLANWTGQAGDAAGARDQYAALLPIRERVSGAEHPTPWPPAPTSPTGPRERDSRARRCRRCQTLRSVRAGAILPIGAG